MKRLNAWSLMVMALLPAQAHAAVSDECGMKAIQHINKIYRPGMTDAEINQAGDDFVKKCDPKGYAEHQQKKQESVKRDAQREAACAQPRKMAADYEKKYYQLGQQLRDLETAPEEAEQRQREFRSGDYKKAFDPVDAAYSAGRQPTPAQQQALDSAEQKLKSLQQEVQARKQRLKQEGPNLKAQYEQTHLRNLEYENKMPQECRPKSGP